MPTTSKPKLVLFCVDPLDGRHPEPDFEREVAACRAVGLRWHLMDWEALVEERRPRRAVRRVPEQDAAVKAIYRGWMMPPERYADLHKVLTARGIELINSPEAYRHCHYLPESYDVIESMTPQSLWLRCGPDVDMDEVMTVLKPFGDGPVVIKDFVKSQKHSWTEACFIPSASERDEVEKVVRRFLELQDDSLAEGLVFREYMDLEPIGVHSRSGMPLTLEHRLFFLDGELMANFENWDEGTYAGEGPPLERFEDIAQRVRSRFFSMDIAKRKDDDWIIIELGDGQVAGLPEKADIERFYRELIST